MTTMTQESALLPTTARRWVTLRDPRTGLQRIVRREDGSPITEPLALPMGSTTPPAPTASGARLDVAGILGERLGRMAPSRRPWSLAERPLDWQQQQEALLPPVPTALELRARVALLGISQRDLAAAAGVSRGAVAEALSERRKPHQMRAMRRRMGETLARLLDFLAARAG